MRVAPNLLSLPLLCSSGTPLPFYVCPPSPRAHVFGACRVNKTLMQRGVGKEGGRLRSLSLSFSLRDPPARSQQQHSSTTPRGGGAAGTTCSSTQRNTGILRSPPPPPLLSLPRPLSSCSDLCFVRVFIFSRRASTPSTGSTCIQYVLRLLLTRNKEPTTPLTHTSHPHTFAPERNPATTTLPRQPPRADTHQTAGRRQQSATHPEGTEPNVNLRE